MLTVTFVRKPHIRDHVYVTRADGSSVNWAFPSYGAGLPHDLCHLVVEQELGIDLGFWGLVEQGVDVQLVDNEAQLSLNGVSVSDAGFDLTDLGLAEDAVAALAGPITGLTPSEYVQAMLQTRPGAAERIRSRLDELSLEWNAGDQTSLTLSFSKPAPS